MVGNDGAPPPPKLEPTAGNGGVCENYVWIQSLSEVVLTVKLTAGITASDCDITVEPYRVRVGEKGKAPKVEGELMHMVRTVDSTWTIDLEDGVATLHLDKVDKSTWWVSVFEGEPEIDITRVEPDHSKLSELDGETRAMVEKMMYDQKQKANGLPTSGEQEKMKKIQEFKKRHPELDFSAARFG